jgi:hypothetical protein
VGKVYKDYRDCKAFKGLLFKEHRVFRDYKDPELREYKDKLVHKV